METGYGAKRVNARKYRRWEINNDYREEVEKAGMKGVGKIPEKNLVEVVEIPELKLFIGTQYHQGYTNTVLKPNPLFVDFIKAAIEK